MITGAQSVHRPVDHLDGLIQRSSVRRAVEVLNGRASQVEQQRCEDALAVRTLARRVAQHVDGVAEIVGIAVLVEPQPQRNS